MTAYQVDFDFDTDKVVLIKARDADAVTNPHSERGWLKLTNNRVEIHTTPGNHLTMFNSENAIALAKILNHYLT